MRKTDLEFSPETKTGRLDAACARYGVGRTTMRKLAADAGAVIHVGRCYLVNFSKLDAWMDARSSEK